MSGGVLVLSNPGIHSLRQQAQYIEHAGSGAPWIRLDGFDAAVLHSLRPETRASCLPRVGCDSDDALSDASFVHVPSCQQQPPTTPACTAAPMEVDDDAATAVVVLLDRPDDDKASVATDDLGLLSDEEGDDASADGSRPGTPEQLYWSWCPWRESGEA